MNTLTISYNSFGELREKIKLHHDELVAGIGTPRVEEPNPVSSILSEPVQDLKGASAKASEGSEIYAAASKMELDAEGLPWDERIHQVGKPKTQQGNWKLKKGKDIKAIVETVKQELRDYVSGKSLPVSNVVLKPFANEAKPEAASITSQPNPFGTNPFQNTQIPGVGYSHTLQTFKANLLMIVSMCIKDNKFGQDFVEQAKQHFGVKDLIEIQQDDTKCSQLFDVMVNQNFIVKLG